jgi:hypothetical protein
LRELSTSFVPFAASADAITRPRPPVAPVSSAVLERSSTAPTYRLDQPRRAMHPGQSPGHRERHEVSVD